MALKSTIKWGVVIQGPIIGFGQGPNNSRDGFSSHQVIHENIGRLSALVDRVIVSTWKDSGFELTRKELQGNAILLENNLPHERDHDNRLKQFLSSLEGVNYLRNNSDVTHVLKIRTDQLVSNSLVPWLSDFYENPPRRFDPCGSSQNDYLVFSEYRDDTPFYLGDFIIAGRIGDVMSFFSANLNFSSTNLHPTIGIDYVLKFISSDQNFKDRFYRKYPLLLQISTESNASVKNYWKLLLFHRFSVVPKEIYKSLVWRSKVMTDVLTDEVIDQFGFYESWCRIGPADCNENSSKNIFHLIPTKNTVSVAKYEYIRYLKAIIKYYLRK